jgi:NAD(P)-dependent dehydrogenase (short-subunit alcohol dehydrogenase family)
MNSARSFEKRVAIVTGAASGIGLAIANRFAAEAVTVVAVDIDEANGNAAAKAIRAHSGKCEFVLADVSCEDEVVRAISAAGEKWGGIDYIINNAGIVLVKSIEESTVEEWDRVMAVNVRSIFLTTKHALPWLKRSSKPAIVNVGSVSSFVGQANTPAYVASKGAVAMLSKTMALDLARFGIRVNCVCPGITDTPMLRFHISKSPDPEKTVRDRLNRVPLARMLTGDDIASAALYLCGPDSAGITGTTLLVDAGYLAAAEWSNT